MNTQSANPNTVKAAQDSPFNQAVAFYVSLPGRGVESESGNAGLLLDYILKNRFRRESIAFDEKLRCVPFKNQVLGCFFVTNRGRALDVLEQELKAVGIWNGAQTAWRHVAEGVWIDYHPLASPPVGIQQRFDAADSWERERQAYCRHLLKAFSILAKEL